MFNRIILVRGLIYYIGGQIFLKEGSFFEEFKNLPDNIFFLIFGGQLSAKLPRPKI
jgi:hypothetical protein